MGENEWENRLPGSKSTRMNRVSALSLATLVVGALMAMTVSTGASGAATAEQNEEDFATSTEHISVAFTPSGAGGFCLWPALAMQQSVQNTPDYFRLTVAVSNDLCSPLPASAVIYEMPGNGVAWPQTLLEKVPFVIQEAGVVEITFTKDCIPAQFDTVTGATPPVISPQGPHHGPLLFPFDISTALQYFPNCTPTTSSTSSTSTTSTSSTTSSTSTTSTTTTTSQPDVSIPESVLGNSASVAQGTSTVQSSNAASLSVTG